MRTMRQFSNHGAKTAGVAEDTCNQTSRSFCWIFLGRAAEVEHVFKSANACFLTQQVINFCNT